MRSDSRKELTIETVRKQLRIGVVARVVASQQGRGQLVQL